VTWPKHKTEKSTDDRHQSRPLTKPSSCHGKVPAPGRGRVASLAVGKVGFLYHVSCTLRYRALADPPTTEELLSYLLTITLSLSIKNPHVKDSLSSRRLIE
jgi:hypothetical protein